MDPTDSSDWSSTPLSSLTPLEDALRCQICKNFLSTPMITSCSHTFCSLCIRRCLSVEGKCPVCRTNEQALRLRNNWAVEELVRVWRGLRGELLGVAKEMVAQSESRMDGKREGDAEGVRERPRKKRKAEDGNAHGQWNGEVEGGRTTRSKSRRTEPLARTNSVTKVHVIEDSEDEAFEDMDADADEDVEFTPELDETLRRARRQKTPELKDGLVACPMCSRRMKEEAVFSHLDRCTGEAEASPAPALASRRSAVRSPTKQAPSQPTSFSTPPPPISKPERLPTITYALLTESTLRKKLSALGISSTGPKPLLQRRHTEWVNIWNANADSSNPKPKNELLRHLQIWEKTQGGHAATAGYTFGSGSSNVSTGMVSGGGIRVDDNRPVKVEDVLRKDFNRAAWNERFDGMFREMIEQGREMGKVAAEKRKKAEEEEKKKAPANGETKSSETIANANETTTTGPQSQPRTMLEGIQQQANENTVIHRNIPQHQHQCHPQPQISQPVPKYTNALPGKESYDLSKQPSPFGSQEDMTTGARGSG